MTEKPTKLEDCLNRWVNCSDGVARRLIKINDKLVEYQTDANSLMMNLSSTVDSAKVVFLKDSSFCEEIPEVKEQTS